MITDENMSAQLMYCSPGLFLAKARRAVPTVTRRVTEVIHWINVLSLAKNVFGSTFTLFVARLFFFSLRGVQQGVRHPPVEVYISCMV